MSKFTIDPDVLCEYCCDYHDDDKYKNTCEANRCVEMKERYIDDMGLTEGLSWKDVSIKDKVYYVTEDVPIPYIRECHISKVILDENNIRISLSNTTHITIAISIAPDQINTNARETFFLTKEKANKKLKSILTEKLVDIAIALGGIE